MVGSECVLALSLSLSRSFILRRLNMYLYLKWMSLTLPSAIDAFLRHSPHLGTVSLLCPLCAQTHTRTGTGTHAWTAIYFTCRMPAVSTCPFKYQPIDHIFITMEKQHTNKIVFKLLGHECESFSCYFIDCPIQFRNSIYSCIPLKKHFIRN